MMPSRPVITIVDDEPRALTTLLDALARRFGGDYRVVSHLSAHAALEDMKRLRSEGERLALVIADQWMPEMTGIELLSRAHEIDPAAQRALLVEWGDRSAAPTIIEGCAFGRIENYIHKPWSPPEVHLYPVVSAFLSAWTRAHGPRMEIVRVVGEHPSPRVHAIRELLERTGIPHGFYPADSEPGRALLAQSGLDGSRLPALVLLDGHVLLDPSNAEISDALGASDDVEELTADLAIVGAGPAGLAAAVYAGSEGLRTLVVEREAVGGQAGSAALIRNYLGFPGGVSGNELAQRAYQQAWLFGVKFVFARRVTGLQARGLDRVVSLSDGRQVAARAVLIATGAEYRRLEVPQLERLRGLGVFYTALSFDSAGDAQLMRDKAVVVVGGGNSAGQAVVHLSQSARRVVLAVRGGSLEAGMSDYLVRDIRQRANVEVRLETEVVDGGGEPTLQQVVLHHPPTGAREAIAADALFVLIGARPHTSWLGGTLERDAKGYVVTGRDLPRPLAIGGTAREPLPLETSMPGVFALGDVRHGSIKRVASAVGDGAVALRQVHDYLEAPVDLGGGTLPPVAVGPVAPSPAPPG